MRYASIRKMDIVNGEGVAVSLFVQGCPFHCKGCFNEETWDFKGGKEFTQDIQNKFIELCNRPYISSISFLGGEPLAQGNEFFSLLYKIRKLFPNKKIFLWTGYKFEDICNNNIIKNVIADCVDILVDGQFEEDKKDLRLAFRGSTNQRIIRVQESLKQNKIVLY